MGLVVIFCPDQRAGRVDKDTARPDQRPQGIKQCVLDGRQAVDITGPPQPADVGVAPDNAGCRAGGVNKNAIKRLSVPPALRLRGVPGQALRRKPQPLKTATDLLQTLSIDRKSTRLNSSHVAIS